MENLNYTQTSTEFIEDINANLQEMSSEVEVAVTDSAVQLVNELNTAFDGIIGKDILSEDSKAEDFVASVNKNFGLYDGSSEQGGDTSGYELPTYKSSQYGTSGTGEMSDTLAAVESLVLDNGAFDEDNLVLILSTDLHTDASANKRFSESASNQKEFIRLASQRGIVISSVACLGDFTDGKRNINTYGTDDAAKAALSDYVLENVKKPMLAIGKPLLLAIGNHDNNVDAGTTGPCLTRKEICDTYLKNNGDIIVDYTGKNDITVGDDTFFHEFYKDYPSQKIRVVVLDCNPVNDTPNAYGATHKTWSIPQTSIDYLSLMFSGTAETNQDKLPSDYKLIVLSHAHFISLSYTSSAIGILADNRDKVMAMFCGHRHKDIASGYPLPALLTGCNKFENDSTTESSNAYYTVPARTVNTSSADLWDVVIVNKSSSIINTIRFGAGFNRRLHTDYIDMSVGDTQELIPSIPSTGEFTWGVQKSCLNSSTAESSTNYISVNNGMVSVIQSSSTYDTFLVWASNSDATWQEYWTIKVS